MKKNIPLIFFIFSSFTIINAQENNLKGKITYVIEGNKSAYNTIEMWFTGSSYIYRYKPSENENLYPLKGKKYENIGDSLADIAKAEAIKKSAERPPQTWFGDLATNRIIYSSYSSTGSYCVYDSLTFMQWELQDDTMTVRGIKCQKATGKYNGMNYIAWFAPSIPVSVAPLQLRGLPGLLIENINLTRNIIFGMVELQWPLKEKSEMFPIKTCTSGRLISAAEMNAILNKENKRFEEMVETLKEAKKNGKTLKLDDIIKKDQ